MGWNQTYIGIECSYDGNRPSNRYSGVLIMPLQAKAARATDYTITIERGDKTVTHIVSVGPVYLAQPDALESVFKNIVWQMVKDLNALPAGS